MSKRTRRMIISLLTSLLLLLAYTLQPDTSLQTPSPAPPGKYNVISYADGDTLTVDMNGRAERIRLIGVDTPETEKPGKPAQCYADKATAFMKERVSDAAVRLEADTKGDNRDRYNRLLRYVYLPDETLLNKVLIEQGYGFAYTQFAFDKKEEFVQAQRNASREAIGLWGECKVTNQNGRFRTNIIQ